MKAAPMTCLCDLCRFSLLCVCHPTDADYCCIANPQSPAMTAPQLMRAVLAALAEPRTFEKGLFMARDKALAANLPPPPPASTFRQCFAVVFVDPSGWLNLAADVTRSALQHVRPPLLHLRAGFSCLHMRSVCCLGHSRSNCVKVPPVHMQLLPRNVVMVGLHT